MAEAGSVRSLNAARDDAAPVVATPRGFCVTRNGFSVGRRPFRRVRRVPAGSVLTPSSRTVLLFPEADGRLAARLAAKDPGRAAFPAFELVPPSGRVVDAMSRAALAMAVLVAVGVASTAGTSAALVWSEGSYFRGKAFADVYLARAVIDERGAAAFFGQKPDTDADDAYMAAMREKLGKAREARKAEGIGE